MVGAAPSYFFWLGAAGGLADRFRLLLGAALAPLTTGSAARITSLNPGRSRSFSSSPGCKRVSLTVTLPDVSVNGPYALCGKCHDLSLVLSGSGFSRSAAAADRDAPPGPTPP